jgi:hypothetical protein
VSLLRRSVPAFIKSNQIRKMKLKIEQVWKGGLPPLVPSISDRGTAGVNDPSRLVQFERLFPFKVLDSRVSKKECNVYRNEYHR